MSPITIVENEFITLQYLPDRKAIYHVIHKPIPDQPLKDSLDAGTEALKKYGINKWLSDDRKNGPLSEEFIEWSLHNWCPRTVAVGWKYWANIVPQEVAAAGALMPVIEFLHTLGLRMMVFSDPAEANKWLDGTPS